MTTVRSDAASDAALDLLGAAMAVAGEIEHTADALLGQFVDQCRRAGHSWTEISAALGVSKQAAHKRFSPGSGQERFTVRARSAVAGAVAAAQRLGHPYVGTEHILLGLTTDANALATMILTDKGATPGRIEAAILARTPAREPIGSEVPLTPRASEALTRAGAEAQGLGHNYVGTEHLLLGLFADPEGMAATVLAELGVTRDAVRDRMIELLAGYTTRS
jgi:hypothetical protein